MYFFCGNTCRNWNRVYFSNSLKCIYHTAKLFMAYFVIHISFITEPVSNWTQFKFLHNQTYYNSNARSKLSSTEILNFKKTIIENEPTWARHATLNNRFSIVFRSSEFLQFFSHNTNKKKPLLTHDTGNIHKKKTIQSHFS